MANTKKVTLKRGIKIDDSTVKVLTLREPSAGEMRGLSMRELIAGDVAETTALLSRICNPLVSVADIESMPISDFALLTNAVIEFAVGE